MAEAQALLADHGYEPRRLRMAAICSVCAESFTTYMREFADSLATLALAERA